MSLITEKDINEILKLISENSVIAVSSPTGSGKSTIVVQAIYNCNAKVFVVQPTVPAVEGLYNRMKTMVDDPSIVGSAMEGNVKYTDKSKIVYCTGGHMRRKMLSLFKDGKIDSINFCDVLIVDEIHGGTIDNDIIQELWKYSFELGIKVPRLVLMSATLSLENTPFKRIPLYTIKIPTYPIELHYHDESYQADSSELYSDTAAVVLRHHRDIAISSSIPPSFPPLKGKEEGKEGGTEEAEVWLVFCPGSGEVEKVATIVRDANPKNMNVITAYSNMPSDQIQRIFDKPSKGTRTLIVATNIMESSITIPNLNAIFDTMVEKYGDSSNSGAFRLTTNFISKSSADQRKGRTGRTGNGYCYRMCTLDFYNQLPAQRLSEINRVPLDSTIIELLSVGLDPVTIFKDRLSPIKIREAVNRLISLNLIENGKVTLSGYFVPHIPLSVYNSTALWHWIKGGYPPFPGIVILTLIDCYGPLYFYYPKKEYSESQNDYTSRRDAHYEKYFSKFNSKSDLETLLKFWKELADEFKSIQPDRRELVEFCVENSFNNKKIYEVFNIIRQVRKAVQRENHVVKLGNFDIYNVLRALIPILQNVYKDSIFNFRGRDYYNYKTREIYKLDNKQDLRKRNEEDKNLIALIKVELGVGKLKIISLSQPI